MKTAKQHNLEAGVGDCSIHKGYYNACPKCHYSQAQEPQWLPQPDSEGWWWHLDTDFGRDWVEPTFVSPYMLESDTYWHNGSVMLKFKGLWQKAIVPTPPVHFAQETKQPTE